MCRFITAVIPQNSDLASIGALLHQYGMSLKEIDNPCLASQVAPDRYLRATRAVCDCDSFLGVDAEQHEESVSHHHYVKDIEKFRKLGWSQNKIERWVSEKEACLNRNQENNRKHRDAELAQWRAFIEAFLSEKTNERLGLIIHEYQTSLELEKFQISRIDKVLVSENIEDTLSHMKRDVIYMFWRFLDRSP